MKTTPFTTRIPRDVLKELKKEAKVMHLHLYQVVWAALEQWLDRRKQAKAA